MDVLLFSPLDSPMGVVNWNTYGWVLLPLAGLRSLHCRSGMVRFPMAVASNPSLSKYSSRTMPSIVVLCKTNHRRCHFCRKKNVRWSKLLQGDMFSDNAWRRITDLDESLNGKLVEVAFFPYRDEGHLSVAGRKTDGAAPPLFAKRVSAYANLERNFRKTTAVEVQLNLLLHAQKPGCFCGL